MITSPSPSGRSPPPVGVFGQQSFDELRQLAAQRAIHKGREAEALKRSQKLPKPPAYPAPSSRSSGRLLSTAAQAKKRSIAEALQAAKLEQAESSKKLKQAAAAPLPPPASPPSSSAQQSSGPSVPSRPTSSPPSVSDRPAGGRACAASLAVRRLRCASGPAWGMERRATARQQALPLPCQWRSRRQLSSSRSRCSW